MRFSFVLSLFAVLASFTVGQAQTPGVLYTWNGTGNTYEWIGGDIDNAATVTNTIPGQLTVVEMGDPAEPFDPGLAHVIRDQDNRRFESSTAQGGLDVWGLEALEIDVSHNGSGPIDVQFFVQATPDYNYVWAGGNGALNGPDFSLAPSTIHTLRFPLNLLTPAQQSYIRVAGLSIRAHAAVGNVTWSVYELRSTGTSPTTRDLATHDVGTSENGLNGAFVNFGNNAVVGNDGGQNQTGLSHNASGSGSLQWTDRGTGGVAGAPSGGAISWGNGTVFDGNSFNERLSDFSNYDTVTFRMSATDPLNGGGVLGVQAFFQTGNAFAFQTTSGGTVGQFGENLLPIDGQFHDLVFPLSNVTDRNNVQVFGVNIFDHLNNLTINVDNIRFSESQALDGDYNQDGTVDAADYVVFRKTNGAVGNYATWRQNFGESSGAGGSAVPEPAAHAALIMVLAVAGVLRSRRCITA
jgi:hypothetical protein